MKERLIAMFLLTIPGTPYLFQGEEIGMTNVNFNTIDDYRDIFMKNSYSMLIKKGYTPEQALHQLQEKSRDNTRTPMQWSSEKHAGFTNGTPWIATNPNYLKINVESDRQNQASIFNYYRDLMKFRKNNLTFIYGDFDVIECAYPDVLIYKRTLKENSFIILLNWSSEKRIISKGILTDDKKLVFSNYKKNNKFELKPWEAAIFKVL